MQVRQNLVLTASETDSLEHFGKAYLDSVNFHFHLLDLMCKILIQNCVCPVYLSTLTFQLQILTQSLEFAPFDSFLVRL